MCAEKDFVSQSGNHKRTLHLRVRVGGITLVGVSNGTIQTITVGNQEQSEKDDYPVDRAELAVDGFDTSNTGRRENVLGLWCLVVALGSRVEDMLIVVGTGGSVLGRGSVLRVLLVCLGRHVADDERGGATRWGDG